MNDTNQPPHDDQWPAGGQEDPEDRPGQGSDSERAAWQSAGSPAGQSPSQQPGRAAVPPPAPPRSTAPATAPEPRRRRSVFRRMATGLLVLLLILSILVNVYLIGAVAVGIRGGLQTHVRSEGAAEQTVAVYSVASVIDGEAVARFRRFYKAVAGDENVRAVVIRVDSPGGGVSASDRIYRMVRQLRTGAGKPVVISMGAVAASGGYYIACGGQEIYAEPTTITGSIGVLSVWPVFKGLMEDVGVEIVTIRSSQARAWKAATNFWEVPDQRVRNDVRDMLDKMHARFADIVRENRENLQTREVRVELTNAAGETIEVTETEPLNGKTYLADAAADLGLIDRVGYLDDAALRAAELAGLDNPRVVEYADQPSLGERLFGMSGAGGVKIDADLLDHASTPRVMMLWKGE